MASQSDETFFNGTVHDFQISAESEPEDVVNATVIDLSQKSKTPKKMRTSKVKEPKAGNLKTSNPNKENEVPKPTREKKQGKTAESKRRILEVLSENTSANTSTPKPKSSPTKIKVNASPRKSMAEKKISATPKIVIYEDRSAKVTRTRKNRHESKSLEGRKSSLEKNDTNLVGNIRSGPTPLYMNELGNLESTDKEEIKSKDKADKSPSKRRGRFSKIDPETTSLLAKLECVFPNLDPEYLKYHFLKFKGSLSETIDYIILKEKTNELPTRADYLRRQETERQQKEYLENFSIENFLKMFPDPWEYFLKLERPDCFKYAVHSLYYLKNKFKKHYTQAIQATLIKNNYSLYRTNKELQKKNRLMKMRATNRTKAECDSGKPITYNEQFMHEMAFIENEAKIKAHIKKTETAKHKKFTQAKKAGTLLECLSCNDPSLLLDDAVNCPANHVFCKDCVVKSVNVEMEKNKFCFKCLVKCEEIFSMESLQRVLTSELMMKIQMRIQQEELKAAEIEDLVWCPFCSYATIMPPELTVLHCLNPDCLKESCRLCKQFNHIPLKCHELEKFDKSVLEEKSEGTEEEEAEDPFLKCIECNQEFLKPNKNNKMVCPCGATICSICQQLTSECPHFKGEPSHHEPKKALSVSDVSDSSNDSKDSSSDSEGFDIDGNLGDFYPERSHSL